jgi:hypothetical protein
MSEVTVSPESQKSDSIIHYLFWLSLVFGAISGGASYFILRFTQGLTWYVLAPILYFINYIIIYYFICNRTKLSESTNEKCDFKTTLKFTSTWIIVYFVVGTAIFYYGW